MAAQRWAPGAPRPQLTNKLLTRLPVGPPDHNWSLLLVLGADHRQVPLVVMSLAPSQMGLVKKREMKRFCERVSMRVRVSPFALHAPCAPLSGTAPPVPP